MKENIYISTCTECDEIVNTLSACDGEAKCNKCGKAYNFSETDPNGKDQHDLGTKLDSGKVKAGVLEDFARALWEVARVGSNGSIKYTRHGWELLPNGIERFNDAKWRHLLKGVISPTDPEWDILHLAHEAWNALAKLELILRKEEGV